MRVCFLIRQLNDGGAQRQLLTLLQGLDRSRCETTVMTFYSGGLFSGDVAQLPGIRLVDLGKKGRWDVLPFISRLVQRLRAAQPDVVYSYLGVSNILSALVAPFLPGTRLVWSVRASDMDFRHYGGLHELVYRVECLLSRFADVVISNSRSGRDHAAAQGFPAGRTVVIPNGVDTARFAPDRALGDPLRREWGIGDDEFLVGLVARIDPMKDYETFIKAAALTAKEHPRARFVCVGVGPNDYATEMETLADSLGISDRLIWAGRRSDMPEVYNALDVLASSSRTEGFPNVVAEAMSCGVPCVVTDVGDSAYIVGETGIVVPPRDPNALAEGISRLCANPGMFDPLVIRERITKNFSMEQMVTKTEDELCCLSSMP